MHTAHTSRHLAPLLPGILLVVGLVSGCDDSAEPAADPTPTTTSSDHGSESIEPTTADADLGPLVDRPTYSFHIPKGWKDTTDDHSVTTPGDTFSQPEDLALGDNRLSIDMLPDTSYGTIEDNAKNLLAEQRDFFSPNIRRLPDIDFEGERAIHTIGPGNEDDTIVQSFYFIRDGDSYDMNFQTVGNRARNDEFVKIVTDSWTWK